VRRFLAGETYFPFQENIFLGKADRFCMETSSINLKSTKKGFSKKKVLVLGWSLTPSKN